MLQPAKGELDLASGGAGTGRRKMMQPAAVLEPATRIATASTCFLLELVMHEVGDGGAKDSTVGEMLEPACFFAGTSDGESWRRRRRKMQPTAKKLQPALGRVATLTGESCIRCRGQCLDRGQRSYNPFMAVLPPASNGAAHDDKLLQGASTARRPRGAVPMREERDDGFFCNCDNRSWRRCHRRRVVPWRRGGCRALTARRP